MAKLPSKRNRQKSATENSPPSGGLVAGGGSAPAKAKTQPSIKGVSISAVERRSLYSVARLLRASFKKKSHLKIPFTTYFQDPFVAKADPKRGLDEKVFVDWEPGLMDGPTSARFAVVDYNADTGSLEQPAEWNGDTDKFMNEGVVLDKNVVLGENSAGKFQFHQVSVWALLQRALEYFEQGNGLGRPIPWAFEGNRLIVVPHAGYGENAYYDRRSKSLQFYYFGEGSDRIFTRKTQGNASIATRTNSYSKVRTLFSPDARNAGQSVFFGDPSCGDTRKRRRASHTNCPSTSEPDSNA